MIHAADPQLVETIKRTVQPYCVFDGNVCDRGDSINEPALTAMLKQIVANNRAGGWRKLKARNAAL